MHGLKAQKWKFVNFQSCRRQWYRLCTKAMITSKGSYGYGKTKNAIACSVQLTHWALRPGKKPGFIHRVKAQKRKVGNFLSCRSQWYRLCTKGMFTLKGSYGYGKPKKKLLSPCNKRTGCYGPVNNPVSCTE